VPRIHMTRSACHWYFARVGQCRSSLPSVAVIVAGTASRFLLNNTLHHLLDAADGAYQMDYFPYLTAFDENASEKGGLTSKYGIGRIFGKGHVVYDPIFGKGHLSGHDLSIVVTSHLNFHYLFHGTKVHGKAATISKPLLDQKRLQAKSQYPKEDQDLRFPALDDLSRPKFLARKNRNMLTFFNHIEIMWNEKVLPSEVMLGKPYDFVMFAHEDALWLDHFNLTAVIAYRNNQADAYMLSCDARNNTPMSRFALNDHGILVRRSKADIFGNYLSTMLQTDMDACHEKVRSVVGEDRGCNSEMILKHIIESNNVTFQPVPSALMPFERSLTVQHDDGRIEHCFHKLCQSKEDPLVIPSNMRRCTEL
jgi:hypothetical protein